MPDPDDVATPSSPAENPDPPSAPVTPLEPGKGPLAGGKPTRPPPLHPLKDAQ